MSDPTSGTRIWIGEAADAYQQGLIDGGAAERERIRTGVALIADRYKNAGVFASCVVRDVTKLLGGQL